MRPTTAALPSDFSPKSEGRAAVVGRWWGAGWAEGRLCGGVSVEEMAVIPIFRDGIGKKSHGIPILRDMAHASCRGGVFAVFREDSPAHSHPQCEFRHPTIKRHRGAPVAVKKTPRSGHVPIDTQGFACSGWWFRGWRAWRKCAADKNAIPRIGGGAGDPKPEFARRGRGEPNAEASLCARGRRRGSSAM